MENKNVRIEIPYKENKDGKSILLALGAIKDYSNVSLETISQLNDSFREGRDIVCDILAKDLTVLGNVLTALGFIYKIELLD